MTVKSILFIAGLAISTAPISAQTKAKTTEGKEVVLYDDGTWQFADDEELKEEGKKAFIPTSNVKYTKSANAKTLYKGQKFGFNIWYNNVKWLKTNTNYEDHEAQFQLKSGDGYAMVIAERMEIPLETLGEAAYTNAKAVAPNVKITQKEYRIVNGHEVLYMTMEGTTQGMNFIYCGYYFSCKQGSLQLVSYTSANIFEQIKGDLVEFINGLDYTNNN